MSSLIGILGRASRGDGGRIIIVASRDASTTGVKMGGDVLSIRLRIIAGSRGIGVNEFRSISILLAIIGVVSLGDNGRLVSDLMSPKVPESCRGARPSRLGIFNPDVDVGEGDINGGPL